MVMVKALEAVCIGNALSATIAENAKVPEVVGVPLIVPSLDNAMPLGSDPDSTDQEYGAVPPVAANICGAYAVSTAPFGSEAVVIDNAVTIFTANPCVAVCGVPELSVTRAVKTKAPATDGVPETTPASDKASPGGSDP